jgi:hypothetical protein
MIQKQNRSLFPGLNLIIIIIVFALGIAFTGILLPSSKSTVNTDEQANTMIPYVDNSSDKSLQLKNVKFNATTSSLPEETETCDDVISSQVQTLTQYKEGPEAPIEK